MKYRLRAALAGVVLLTSACTNPGSRDATSGAGPGTTAIVQYNKIHHPVLASGGMVVSQNRAASQVGERILARGGNATDAAVATAFALAVTLPRAGNLGGSGFFLGYDAQDSQITALDFRSAAPSGFRPDRYRDANGVLDRDAFRFGPLSAAVPGTVAGLHRAWQDHGSLPWAELVAPAEQLARTGISVSADLAFALGAAEQLLRQFPGSAGTYLTPARASYRLGDTLRQTALANSLALIAQKGAETFYRGALGARIAAAVQRDGGVMAAQDLQSYRVRERKALVSRYRDHQVYVMPPVSGGGVTLLQMLNILARFDLSALPRGGAQHLHLLAEAMKQGAASRRSGIGDPDFGDLQLEGRLSARAAEHWASQIRMDRPRPVRDVRPAEPWSESRDTTHLSVVDAQGNAVALTYTLGYSFGSGYVAGDTGILLDNQMQNFYYDEPGHANAFAPGKRMMSTMTPTIVLDPAGKLFLVTGTPGGSRIVNAVLQVLVNAIDYQLDIASATHAPRIHQNWQAPAVAADNSWAAPALQVEATLSRDVRRALAALGHQVEPTQTIGSTQSIMVRDGVLQGAADPRRPDAHAAGSQATPSGRLR